MSRPAPLQPDDLDNDYMLPDEQDDVWIRVDNLCVCIWTMDNALRVEVYKQGTENYALGSIKVFYDEVDELIKEAEEADAS